MDNSSDLTVEINSPAFIQALESCLIVRVSTSLQIIEEGKTQIKVFKDKVRHGMAKRKDMKKEIHELKQKKTILESALKRLELCNKKTSQNLMMITANVDVDNRFNYLMEKSNVEKIERNKIIWENYKAEFEKFPLAVIRENARIEMEKIRIEVMKARYNLNEFMKTVNQRRTVEQIKIHNVGVECAQLWKKRCDREKRLASLKKENKDLKEELMNIQAQVKTLLTERGREAKTKITARMQMPPPFDLAFMMSMYKTSSSTTSINDLPRISQDEAKEFSDTSSVNTLILEEMLEENNDEVIEEQENPSLSTPVIVTPMESQIAIDSLIQTQTPMLPVEVHRDANVDSTKNHEQMRMETRCSDLQMKNTQEPLRQGNQYRESISGEEPKRHRTESNDEKNKETETKKAKLAHETMSKSPVAMSKTVEQIKPVRKMPPMKMVMKTVNFQLPRRPKSPAANSGSSKYFPAKNTEMNFDDNASDALGSIAESSRSFLDSMIGTGNSPWGTCQFTPPRITDSEIGSFSSTDYRDSENRDGNETPFASHPGMGFSLFGQQESIKFKKLF